MKLCVLAATVLFIFAGVAFGQTGILSLQEGKSAVGLGYQWYNPSEKSEQNTGAQNIRGSFDWQFNRFLKTSFILGVAFLDTENRKTDSIPPSPSFELRLTKTGSLNSARTLDYFIRGDAQVRYSQIHNESLVSHHVNTTLTGGIGILYKLETVTEWQFNPFFGVFYSNVWRNISTAKQILTDDTYNLFIGEAGIEIEVSPAINIIGSAVFSFETSEIIYNIGINFR